MSQHDPRPWYPRYPRDFWTSVDVLRLLELHSSDGALLYQFCLDSAWECGLPNDAGAIYALLPRVWPMTRQRFDLVFADVRPLLVEVQGGRYLSHPRLEEARDIADRRRSLTPEQIEQRRLAGIKSAERRRERAGTAQPAKPDAPNGASNGIQRTRTEPRTEPVRGFSNGSVRETPNGASNGDPNGLERSRTDSNGDPHRTVTGLISDSCESPPFPVSPIPPQLRVVVGPPEADREAAGLLVSGLQSVGRRLGAAPRAVTAEAKKAVAALAGAAGFAPIAVRAALADVETWVSGENVRAPAAILLARLRDGSVADRVRFHLEHAADETVALATDARARAHAAMDAQLYELGLRAKARCGNCSGRGTTQSDTPEQGGVRALCTTTLDGQTKYLYACACTATEAR